MGPMQALVAYGALFYNPYIEQVIATQRRPLIKVVVRDDGHASYEQLPEGTVAEGTGCARTLNKEARLFKDDFEYTIAPGAKREVYLADIERLKPTKALMALKKYLRRKQTPPKWVIDLVQQSKKSGSKISKPLFIPYVGKKSVFSTVKKQFLERDPLSKDGRVQMDCVTGEVGKITSRTPIRILDLGARSGVTFMSTDEDVFGGYGCTKKKHRAHQVPVTDATKNLHVYGMQKLIHDKAWVYINDGPTGTFDGRARCFAWTASGHVGVDRILLDLLKGELKPEQLEELSDEDMDDMLCVFVVREGKRAQYLAWHYLPAFEALDNICTWMQSMQRGSGHILGVRDVAQSCVNYRTSDPNKLRQMGESICTQKTLVALVAHIVEGAPFPKLLSHLAMSAYVSQSPWGEIPRYHSENQKLLMEAAR